jgi:5-methylcytosine-specific restriction endonuclease McrA
VKPRRAPHLALYGNIAIRREWCWACQRFALVVDNSLGCCNRSPSAEEVKKIKRFSSPEDMRKQLPAKIKARILADQEFRCIYCRTEFKGRVHFDHLIPFAFAQNNGVDNFVAACPPCNLHKSDKIFDSLEAAQQYFMERRQALASP